MLLQTCQKRVVLGCTVVARCFDAGWFESCTERWEEVFQVEVLHWERLSRNFESSSTGEILDNRSEQSNR